MLPKVVLEDLKKFIETHELDERTAKLVADHAELSLQYKLTEEEDYSSIGNSRIAGCPDLPPSIDWPIDSDGEYWTFIAQINLEELPVLPFDGFPKRGILYFFLGLDEPAYNIDHRIYYYDGEVSLLKKTEPPEGLEEIAAEYRGFVSHKISFDPVWTLPEQVRDILMDEVPEVYDKLEHHSDTLWGQYESWAGDTPLDAYLCRNGMEDLLFKYYKTVEEVQREASEAEARGSMDYAQRLRTQVIPQLEGYLANEDKHKQGAKSWHPLLSVSSLDEAGMCWWDAGILEFFIDKSDLERLDFSRSYVNLATS
ncbi:YwqG family protein [Paenibacillus sp. OAS669]|uniref:YwqG family protein n=1 Tax=Paenibacillus sp. OAS669 TaxID=2663821 RepID=UPI00178BBE21|nr:YwqG family protein [Paenibacillus sp. OAS669]MBE1442095.1 uncharacterized protein YwqG [Paenibacillus sp. OAS669]